MGGRRARTRLADHGIGHEQAAQARRISVFAAMRCARALENSRVSCKNRGSEIVATDRACCCASQKVVNSPEQWLRSPFNTPI